MRLVDHEQRDVGDGQLVEHLLAGELLGRQEQELERPLGQLVQRVLALARAAIVEFSCAAPPAQTLRSASTWSRCSAISGETTSVAPGVSIPAIW